MAYPIRGRVVVTAQLLKEMLGLPNEVEVISLDVDQKRGLVGLNIRSDEKIEGLTFPVAEGQEIPVSGLAMSVYGLDDEGYIPPPHMVIYERVRNMLVGTVPDEEETDAD